MEGQRASVEVYLGNLRAYTEGKPDGEWISLPQNEEQLNETVKRISRNGQDEVIIMETAFREDCRYLYKVVGEFSQIRELNTVSRLIGEQEHPAVRAYVENNSGLSLTELANVFVQEENLPFYPYEFRGSDNPEIVESMTLEERMGYSIIESNQELAGILDVIQVGNGRLRNYIDAEAIGRDLSLNGDVYLMDHGYYDVKAAAPDLGRYTMDEIRQEHTEVEQQDVRPQEQQKKQIRHPEQKLRSPSL